MKIKVKVVGRIEVPKDRCVVLDHVRLTGEDFFPDRELMQFCVIGSRLERCRFDGFCMLKTYASFGAGTEQSEYIDCTFDGAKMYISPGGRERFVRCSFRNVDIREWLCTTTELIDCTFSGRLRKAIFHGTVPEKDGALLGRKRNEFHGNDFSGMDLINVDFRKGIDLTQQRLPSGPQYLYLPDAAASLARARSELVNWEGSPEACRVALQMVDNWLEDEVLKDGQQQLFLRPENYYGYSALPREAIDKVFSLLRPS